MLTFIDTTIFEIYDANVLINTVNCVGVMGKGLALEFKHRFPENYKVYKKHCRKESIKIGVIFNHVENDIIIMNFPTKIHWKNNSEYEWIEKGLKTLRASLITLSKTNPDFIVAIPKLGCNNGGLQWNVVKKLIQSALSDINLTIYICEK